MAIRVDWLHINFWRLIPLAIVTIPQVNARADTLLGAIKAELHRPVSEAVVEGMPTPGSWYEPTTELLPKGEVVAGYRLSSDVGWRDLDGDGYEEDWHEGYDLATPVGTPLYAPADVDVRVFTDGGGGGLVAEFADPRGTVHKFLHLDWAKPGKYKAGEMFAKTGKSGNNVPHLDYRAKNGSVWEKPNNNILESVLTGEPKKETLVAVATESTGGQLPVDFDINNGSPDDEVTAVFHGALNLGITDPQQIAYILATAQHESASFSTTQEIGDCNYFAYVAGGGGYSHILGNNGPGDACKFSGKGLVQLTGKNNFKRMESIYGRPYVQNPELVEEPGDAIAILIEGMMGGWFTGHSLPEFVAGGRADYWNARRVVNGTDKAAHIAAIAQGYEPKVRQWLITYGY